LIATIPRPTERRQQLLDLFRHRPADLNVRGFFVYGPQMTTNWDLLNQYMAESAVERTSGRISDALELMELRERSARAKSGGGMKRLVNAVLNGPRTRVRRQAA
jgi:hypothetical protein